MKKDNKDGQTVRIPSEKYEKAKVIAKNQLYTTYTSLIEILIDAAIDHHETNAGAFPMPIKIVSAMEYQRFQEWDRSRNPHHEIDRKEQERIQNKGKTA